MNKILCLDVGSKGIGVAKGYMENHMAFPICTLTRRSVQKDVVELASICAREGVDHIVVGLPLLLDGTEGRSARLARQVGSALSEKTGLTVDYEDERDSSKEAADKLRSAGKRSKRHKAIIDQQAAIVILERWFLNH